ncbi:hypothetical protein Q0Z83_060450 [Actinoplanes sichuanensis]|uniref:WhiB family transcriptional regulator n=1 Tax=Actinoplanes sichuanensis TaxID=512349 RepID=A0ABW4A6N9_9ACTN|nr:WhiB family transcriptional regulator [Actinoplanes sichuanensis]BEL07854.1 hypothetical protein Q0Z83_060450 [Actinoplanes sichuanensis]
MTRVSFMEDPARGCAPGRVDPDIFFASPRLPEVVEAGLAFQAKLDKARARRTCRERCRFAQACFTRAESNGDRYGIWGGVDMANNAERRQARKRFGLAERGEVTPETDEVLVERVLNSGPAAFKALTDDRRALVVRAAVGGGMSWTAMERKFRVRQATLRALAGEGVEGFDQQVQRLYHEGRSDQAIALTLGCDQKKVKNTRARLGLPALFGPGGRLRRRIADVHRSRAGVPA